MDLIRDLLDMAVVDRNGREMGRVDSVVIEMRPGAPPRVTAIEIGPAVLAYRVRPILGSVVARLEHVLGIAEERPIRIPIGQILDIGDRVKVDCAAGETGALTMEKRLRAWIRAIPGSG